MDRRKGKRHNTDLDLCYGGARLSLPDGVVKRLPEREYLYSAPAYKRVRARFRANLRRIRREKGLTHEQAGALCGKMTMQQFQMLESGDANLTFRTVSRIVEGLGVDVSELFAPTKPTK